MSTDNHRKTIGEWLSKKFVWRIPVYQRHYAWDAANPVGPVPLFWETVKEQTDARLRGENPHPHYLGAVLVDNKTRRDATDGIMEYDVVDGQQRLTTVQIALLSIIRVAEDQSCGQELKDKLAPYLLVDVDGVLPKLQPTNFDRKQYESALFETYRNLPSFREASGDNVSKENAAKSKIITTSQFFDRAYGEILDASSERPAKEVLTAIANTLTNGFELVLIVLKENDEAQRIFESLNNYAKPLTTFDLIRNNVFSRTDSHLFYTQSWQQLEKPYWEEKADNRKVDWATHIEAYIARMLVAKLKYYLTVDRNSIVRAYKKDFVPLHSSVQDEIKSLAEYAPAYQYLDCMEGSKNPISESCDFSVFRYDVWNNRDFYPVIFSIVGADLDTTEKTRMIRLLESYVVRRAICKLPSANYNQYVADLCRHMKDNVTYARLQEIMELPDKPTAIFPSNEMVIEKAQTVKFYRSALQYYVFTQIEKSLHDQRDIRVSIGESGIHIDHILPQGWEKNDAWKSIVLSGDQDAEMEALMVNTHLDTIGNLTILSGTNNSAKSNKPLDDVKELLQESTVKLNRELANESEWGVKKIASRSREIAQKICQIWLRQY